VTRPDETDEMILSALSQEARRQAAADAADLPRPGAWHRLEERRGAPRAHGLRWWTGGVVLGAAACAVLVFLVLGIHTWRSARALTYDVGGGAVEEGGYIRGATATGSAVRFSDGTQVDLGAGARMSVVAPGAHGARLRVDEGEAHFSVMHLPHAAWSVEAGPYLIEVTGTVFDVRWSSRDEIAEVRLRAGSVRVSGPLLAEHATLRPGQHLTARLATRELRIDENVSAPAAPTIAVPPPAIAAPASAAIETPPATDATPGPATHLPAPARAGKAAARKVASAETPTIPEWAPQRWQARVSAGDAKSVVAEAVSHGIDAVVADADGPALVALADAARYAGRTYLAERVLRAQRTRFPGTPAAGAAAFFLGRLAEDRGAPAEGLDWYRRYLSDEPSGPYAAEALGREMIGVAGVSGQPAARALALEYLRRFPEGTYLLHAQAILRSSSP
jgi:ferric-dicitrate binding protein FerR (iron transport regulator)